MTTGTPNRDAVGVYGKIPAQGDFVRINASDPSAQALDAWIQESLESLQRAGSDLPSEPVFFVHHGATPSHPGLVGVLLRSADRVGRAYPLAVFARLDPAWLAGRFSVVPTAFSLFLADAARLGSDLDRVDAALLAARSRALRFPTVAEIAQADAVCTHVLHTFSTADLFWRLFPGAPAGRHLYAFKTALDACDTTRSRPPRVPITLDCPVASDVDLFVWMELCRRRLYGAPVLPSCVWREGPAARAMLSLGPASGSLLRFLVRPDDQATQLWPLASSRPDAIDLARHGLGPHHRQVLEGPAAPLEALLATLAH